MYRIDDFPQKAIKMVQAELKNHFSGFGPIDLVIIPKKIRAKDAPTNGAVRPKSISALLSQKPSLSADGGSHA